MLNINLEFRHGVFFIRLNGVLTNKTKKKLYNVKKIVEKSKMRFIAFNFENLINIDNKSILYLNGFYDYVSKLNGMAYICGINKNINKKLENSNITYKFREEENELNIMHNIDLIYNE